ncbi:hypothetical protein Sjap_009351 [Stephania japonica]|uniref:Uncharacterized protein n=1 Tax=Stephania japonica TaxID=461633 RepID=A0AAP0PC71_9MAGN
MAMNMRACAFLLVFVAFAAIVIGNGGVEASRLLPEDFACANHLATYPSVASAAEKARATLSCWLNKLESGPSPRGPGH